MRIAIFTDGSTSKNGKPDCIGGWGAVLLVLNGDREVVHYKELSGGKKGTSIGEMEMMAAYESIRSLDFDKAKHWDIHVVSDSQYVVNAFSERCYRWKMDGWLDRPNLNLIKSIYRMSEYLDVKWHWVKGHDGNKYNERADELAKEAKERVKAQC
ncbi:MULTISPECIES: ribonuclease H [unclassified Paenibacillus]|uniref:ribonuclease H family protein n=1 Tax=unclassified Paenibacillus TaxID=185978 RepID=UPI000894BAAF|nr:MULTISPECIES: ribonuclease H [unclassified Paenibacillus]OMC68613.1 hypothetical protein BK126_12355 [Paenibacillus sp. FSL H7-0326]SDW57220.1 ribonuclease HI [Paenibacillus sp. PDC88]